MKVNRSNYEIWIIDWLDGNLSEPQSAELLSFLEENPDLKEEMEALTRFRLEKPLNKSQRFDSLKKPAEDITDTQFEYLCIAHIERDLFPEQEKELEKITQQYPARKEVLDVFRKTILTPPDNRYNKKSLLKKKTTGEKILTLSVRFLSAAASLALLFSLYVLITNRFQENKIAYGQPQSDTLTIIRSKPLVSERQPLVSEKQISAIASNIIASAALSSTEVVPEETTADIVQAIDSLYKFRPVEGFHIMPNILLASINIVLPADINNLIAYIPEKTIPADNYERSRIGSFLSRTYRDLILNEEVASDLPIKGYEIAEGGINGLNKLLGWEMALQKTNDENGDLQSLYFSSKMLKFNAPVKKTTTNP